MSEDGGGGGGANWLSRSLTVRLPGEVVSAESLYADAIGKIDDDPPPLRCRGFEASYRPELCIVLWKSARGYGIPGCGEY